MLDENDGGIEWESPQTGTSFAVALANRLSSSMALRVRGDAGAT
jgi:hypothetical protein